MKVTKISGSNLIQAKAKTNTPVIFMNGKVDSVNGKTGDVVLTAQDVHALPDTTIIPKKVSELENDLHYLTNQDISNKVDKVPGKGLSTNDYTNEDKQKLAGLQNYDDTNIQNEINSLNGLVDTLDKDVSNMENDITALQEESEELLENINQLANTKADKAEIPDISHLVTKTTTDLVNYYLKSETYTQQEVNQLIGAIKTISMKVLPEKPQTGEANIIYLIPSAKSEPENIYDEWIYVNDKWELIGSTQIDLSNYYTKDEITQLLFDYITSNDLEEILGSYIKDTDYATASKGGVVKADGYYGLYMDSNGKLRATADTYATYQSRQNTAFISKETLENVIVGKELINKTQMEEYINSLDGNEVAY